MHRRHNLVRNLIMMGGGNAYQKYIIATSPIAYWPLNEISGAVAVNYGTLGTAANGSYTAVTLAQTPAPGGGLAPSFDGATSLCEIDSVALSGAFSGLLCTISIWFRVSGVGVWTDGTADAAITLLADMNNYVQIVNPGVPNNSIIAANVMGGAAGSENIPGFVGAGWYMFTMTYSDAADEGKSFVNGVQAGGTHAIGTWVGALAGTNTCIGSESNAGSNFWNGYLAHATIWSKVLTPTEILALYNGGL